MATFDRNALLKTLKVAKDSEKSGAVQDQRLWKPEVPEKGKSVYKIRVLPVVKNNSSVWTKVFKHNIKLGDGKYINEDCPVTIGKPCPICDHSAGLFNTGDPADEKRARNLWRKKNFFANILVVKDPRNEGANEGKIFLYRFGTKIYEKFDSALFPSEESGETQLFFVDPVEGYDFNLICKTVGTGKDAFPNYDESIFVREATPISKDSKEVDKILNEVYDIETEFLSPSKFKSYAELENILNTKILGVSDKMPERKIEKSEEKNSKPAGKTEDKPVEKVEKKSNVKTSEEKSDDDFLASLEEELKDSN